MPLFEYLCKKCGKTTEFLEKADNRGSHTCEHCGSSKTEKMLSTFAAKVASTPACGTRSKICADRSCCPTCPMSRG